MRHDEGQEIHGEDFDDDQKKALRDALTDMLGKFSREHPEMCHGCTLEFFLYYCAVLMAASTWDFDDVIPILAGAFDVKVLGGDPDDLPEEIQQALEAMIEAEEASDDDDPVVH
jgi:hypothetical protein